MAKSIMLARRDFIVAATAITASLANGLWTPGAAWADGASLDDWSKAPDIEKAKVQAAQFNSYGMPDSWANYGEVLQGLGKKYGVAIHHDDTDMNSLEEVTKFDAEKDNPVAISADIGILFGPVAEQRGVVPPYMPPNAAKLPAGLKGVQGGWVATFTGVPALVVNTDVVKNVPRSWDDLLKPEYKGKVQAIDASSGSGTDVAVFLAWAYSHGGDENNLQPGVDFARHMLDQFATASGTNDTLEKGEVPIQMKYDFNCIASATQLQAKGVHTEVIIPGISIYAPGALMLNKYNTAKMDIAKLLLDYVLSDEGQTAFAKFGARPIRAVLGDFQVPESARGNWLPDAQYAQVKSLADWSKVDLKKITQTWQDQVAGG
ncbi:MAG: ABC transporter substrate-binding protein [Dongiaceae bacterium]